MHEMNRLGAARRIDDPKADAAGQPVAPPLPLSPPVFHEDMAEQMADISSDPALRQTISRTTQAKRNPTM